VGPSELSWEVVIKVTSLALGGGVCSLMVPGTRASVGDVSTYSICPVEFFLISNFEGALLQLGNQDRQGDKNS
jgi:hypothetical protein